jgi:hypothetical protein
LAYLANTRCVASCLFAPSSLSLSLSLFRGSSKEVWNLTSNTLVRVLPPSLFSILFVFVFVEMPSPSRQRLFGSSFVLFVGFLFSFMRITFLFRIQPRKRKAKETSRYGYIKNLSLMANHPRSLVACAYTIFDDLLFCFRFFSCSFSFVLFFYSSFTSVSDKMTKKGSSAASSPSAALENTPASPRFICSMCAKVYRSGAGLRYHKRKRHRGRLVLSRKDPLTE